jgi:hypothetical protein
LGLLGRDAHEGLQQKGRRPKPTPSKVCVS